jgi:hypothetical protein
MKKPIELVEDAFGRPLEHLLYGYGARLNIPWRMLTWIDEAIDFVRAPIDYLERRRMARRLLRQSRWRGFMPKSTGHCLVNPSLIPSLMPAVRKAVAIQSARSDAFVHADSEKVPFLTGVLSPDDLKSCPELVEFALSPEMVEIVTDYLGTVPRLAGVDFMYTAAQATVARNSQLWHLDKPEVNYVQCFVCLNEVGDFNGPFTFLPAAGSERVCRETGYHHRSSLGNGRLEDDEFDRHRGTDELVSLKGPPGSGAIVDTSRCLHFGARLQSGHRLMIAFRYAPAHRIMQNAERRYSPALAAGDRLRLKVLTGGNPVPAGFGRPSDYEAA